jgi:hypothetical protein
VAGDENMTTFARLCLGFSVSIVLVAPAVAELATIAAPVTMRAGPSGKAGVVERIPESAQIDVEKCARNWCRGSWRGRFGYVPAEAIVLGSPPSALPGDKMPPPVVNVQPTHVAPPAWRWTGPYLGLNGGFGSGSW